MGNSSQAAKWYYLSTTSSDISFTFLGQIVGRGQWCTFYCITMICQLHCKAMCKRHAWQRWRQCGDASLCYLFRCRGLQSAATTWCQVSRSWHDDTSASRRRWVVCSVQRGSPTDTRLLPRTSTIRRWPPTSPLLSWWKGEYVVHSCIASVREQTVWLQQYGGWRMLHNVKIVRQILFYLNPQDLLPSVGTGVKRNECCIVSKPGVQS